MAKIGSLDILDFDVENRPLTYLGDWSTAEVTVAASCWIPAGLDWRKDSDIEALEVEVFALTRPCPKCEGKTSLDVQLELLEFFEERYEAADMVVGHYIRGHDLPVLNGARLEASWEPLPPILTQDTKLDLKKSRYLSLSQENLSATLGLSSPKINMDQAKWRSANRLEDDGIRLAVERAVGDVRQNVQLRGALLEMEWLRPPVVWRGDRSYGAYRA